MVEARGGVLFIYRVDDAESWRHGTLGSQRQMCHDEPAQGGGTLWPHGGVDGKPDERLCFDLSPWSWVGR
jgi:hypothetical protein